MPTTFPHEIIEQFIDFLHDDRLGLAVCGLVGSAWVPRSRYHLFKSVRLRSGNVDGFILLLRSKCRLTFLESIQRFSYIHREGLLDRKTSQSLSQVLQHLPPLPGVVYLSLIEGWGREFVFDDLDSYAITTLFPNVVEFTLSHTCFNDSGDVFKLISRFPLLQILELNWVDFANSTSNLENLSNISTKLQSLSLHGGTGVPATLMWLRSQEHPQFLRRLSFQCLYVDDLNVFRHLCQDFGENLVEMVLTIFILEDFSARGTRCDTAIIPALSG